MLPIRDGAGVSLSRSLASLAASPVVPLVTSPVCSLVRRSGDSCGDTKPSRTGRSKAAVSVWAWAKRTSNATSARTNARHGDTGRKDLARLQRPLAGPEITIKIPQPNHSFKRRVPAPRERAPMENVVNGVKTIMVNGRVRTAPRSHGRPGHAKEWFGRNRRPSPGTRHVQVETADDKLIRHR